MYRLTILAVLSVLLGLATAVAEPAAKPTTSKSPISPTRLASSTSKLQSRPCKKRRTRKSSPLPSRWWAIILGEQSSARTGQKANVTPEDNPTSQTLTKQADVTRNKFPLDGAAFDKAHVDNEVSYRKTVNTALSGTLIPDAQNPELKALLQSGLTLFEAHQKHAEQLAGQLHYELVRSSLPWRASR